MSKGKRENFIIRHSLFDIRYSFFTRRFFGGLNSLEPLPAVSLVGLDPLNFTRQSFTRLSFWRVVAGLNP
jgi:hypothetical protein